MRASSTAEDRIARLWLPIVLGAVAAALVFRLSAFGIWDPWELEAADSARRLIEGKLERAPHAGIWLVGQGFRLLGISELAGRLPMALSGLFALGLLYALLARFVDRRTAVYGVVVGASSPLFIFNARAMLGEAPAFALQGLLALSAARATLDRGASRRLRYGHIGLLLLATLLAIEARGALLGALPPLLAAAVVAAADGRLGDGRRDPAGSLAAWVLWGLSLLIATMVLLDASADRISYSPWLGGGARGGQPPGFHVPLVQIFHAFAPFSALLPLALAHAVASDGRSDEGASPNGTRQLGLLLGLWAGFGYGAQTLYLSRYGDAVTFLPLLALAGLLALLLRDFDRRDEPSWALAICAALLTVLLIRDYALYPTSPVRGVSVASIEVPEVFNPKRYWTLGLGLFAGIAVLSLASARQPWPEASGERSWAQVLLGRVLETWRAPYGLLAQSWRRGWGPRLWLLALVMVLLALEVFGLTALIAGERLRLSTQAMRWAKRLMLVPPALPVAVALVQLAFTLFGLSRRRALPLLIAGALCGLYAAQGFMPALSAHFSPRDVYDRYNELAAEGEPLGEHQVGGRAAAYYARGDVVELESRQALVSFLAKPGRRWAVFPTSDLPQVDRDFRRQKNQHLFVADARSARVLLATNSAIEGRENQSFLVRHVHRTAPKIQHPVKADLEDKIRFLGYDLKLPHGDHVGAGERFEVTWYFEALQRVTGNWKIFVHIDSAGQRIHGDHFPVDGKYPVALWEKGDIIADSQQLDVPGNYRSGEFTIFLGFYSGENRLKVAEGPKDDANRIRAGVLRIR
ncbi:MAG: glycosyltransferase family 39 protein [Myxococcales bacterium]|nr:glycosyltransferase family 39 protein [Myxococcales bacterium]